MSPFYLKLIAASGISAIVGAGTALYLSNSPPLFPLAPVASYGTPGGTPGAPKAPELNLQNPSNSPDASKAPVSEGSKPSDSSAPPESPLKTPYKPSDPSLTDPASDSLTSKAPRLTPTRATLQNDSELWPLEGIAKPAKSSSNTRSNELDRGFKKAAGPANAFSSPLESSAADSKESRSMGSIGGSAGRTAAVPFDFADLVEQSQASVVQVRVQHLVPAPISPIDQSILDFLKSPQARPRPPADALKPRDAQRVPTLDVGSGFFIDEQGHLLTNAHVIRDAQKITLRLQNDQEITAQVIGLDLRTDIALLKADPALAPYKPLRLGSSDTARVGEWVLAIGSPFGFQSTATVGILSAKDRNLSDDNYLPFLQTDAAVNPGNSGGPLLSWRGQVIGINTQIYSSTGGYEGLSFSIPIDYAIDIARRLKRDGVISHGRVGAVIQDLNPDLIAALKVPSSKGSIILQVEPGSPSDRAGLKSGDAILKVDGQAIDSSLQFIRSVAQSQPGSTLSISVFRGGRLMDVPVLVGKFPTPKTASSSSAQDTPVLKDLMLPLLGLDVMPASSKEGLMITQARGQAADAGLRSGDVLLTANGNALKSIQDLQRVIKNANQSPLAFLALRKTQLRFVVIKPVTPAKPPLATVTSVGSVSPISPPDSSKPSQKAPQAPRTLAKNQVEQP